MAAPLLSCSSVLWKLIYTCLLQSYQLAITEIVDSGGRGDAGMNLIKEFFEHLYWTSINITIYQFIWWQFLLQEDFVGKTDMAARNAFRYVSRRLSSSGKVLSEEEKAAENVYIKVIL